ncbi:MAG: hypothetical protein U0414_10485 [Polyangiaceae bacterium]
MFELKGPRSTAHSPGIVEPVDVVLVVASVELLVGELVEVPAPPVPSS